MPEDNIHPITSEDIVRVLSETIKEDDDNKLITFLGMLLAYTRSSQFNISFNAPSSTGKSFIPTEVAKLFPQQDVVEIGYATPTSFFHDHGAANKTTKELTVDFSRKILIFLDMPHNKLLERLRPLLSHDKYEMNVKITDRQEKMGIRTKNVVIKGFPVVLFCSAGLKLDEQETTRMFLLSPEIKQDKLRQAILSKIEKEADSVAFSSRLEESAERIALKERIAAIREANIEDVIIPEAEKKLIEERFLAPKKSLQPRHQRDIQRLTSLVKAFALLNFDKRQRRGDHTIIAELVDIEEAFALWDRLSAGQDYNIPPYVLHIYRDILVPLWDEKRTLPGGSVAAPGLTREDISTRHYKVYGRTINQTTLTGQILPMLETAGLILQEASEKDKRQKLIYPTAAHTIVAEENNTIEGNGVKNEESKTADTGEINVDDIPF